jgi:ABC-2 type transport system permease protein
MRFLSIFRKSMKEQLRDLTVLGLTLVFAPLFVYLYWIFFPSGSTTFSVLVLNHDTGVQLQTGVEFSAGEQIVEALNGVTYPDGNPLLRARDLEDPSEVATLLRDREATVYIDIPEDFSRSLLSVQQGELSTVPRLIFGGDLTNPYYSVAAILATSTVDAYVQEITGQGPVIHYLEEPLGASAARTEFETYMPGILIFAAIMLIFTASMTVAREVEAGTLMRLKISLVRSWEWLGGITATLIIVGVVAVLLTFLTAVALGFRSQGPIWVAILVAVLTSVSVIGAGMVVAAFSNTVARAFVIANFPLGLFMFFSGVIYPMPKVPLFTLAGYTVSLYDILPPTHAIVALNKIMNLGSGLKEVLYELSALLLLSVAYFALGVWIFQRRHMQVRYKISNPEKY